MAYALLLSNTESQQPLASVHTLESK
jgi:hypothetical protein